MFSTIITGVSAAKQPKPLAVTQPRKEQGKKSFGRGKQLNATWQGQLNATLRGKPDWGIDGDSTSEEEESSDEEEQHLLGKGLTEA
ncbi:hypothetical protein V491_00048 [Pseudogymnoascus sp. VKM F-3775]|nr:hypothetical protein V491_00048 [Pseudogymnoascus sp. VKM F-3775]